jgi:precorrin-2/cobalt-factor-2 C20-methyltransferase
MTLKAVRLLEQCSVWLVPKGREEGESTALAIAAQVVAAGGKEILAHYFPMKKIRMGKAPAPEAKQAWQEAAALVIDRLREGRDVVFPTLGDPAIYSTGFYLCDTLLELAPGVRVEIVPGVSAMGAAAALAGQPLCLGDDRLVVIPATFENGRLRETLLAFDTVVLMKVHRVMDRLVPLLSELDLLDKAVLVERSGQNGERISRDLDATQGRKLHYFSTVIVRKAGSGSGKR